MTWKTLPRSEGAGGLACHITGQGPPLVLIHGVGLRSEAWGGLIPELSDHFKLVVADMPGHGHSAPITADNPSLGDFTSRLAEFIEPFGQPVVVVGHSMGAMIALDLAIQHPALVSAVTALNAIFQRSDAAREAVTSRAQSLNDDTISDPSAPLSRWFGNAPPGEFQKAHEACKDWLTGCDPAGYATAYRIFAQEDGPDPDDLARLQCPALFITGADEPNSTPAMSQAMADLAPLGTCKTVKGAAHMAPMTHAAAIATEMLKFAGTRQAA